MNIITIDCGASFVKGAAFKDNIIIKEISQKAPGYSLLPIPGNGRVLELCKIVENMIFSLSNQNEDNYICISNEMHGFLLVDSNNELVTDYISWQLDLGDSFLNSSLDAQNLIIKSGMSLRGGLPLSNLSYLIKSETINAGQQFYFYTLGDYIIKNISGYEPYISISNAAATGLFDIISNDWNYELINLIGAEQIIFPKVENAIIEFKKNNVRYLVLPSIGDQQAALLGAGLSDKETLSFNIGTGAQVSRLSEVIELSNQYQVRPYFNNMYLITIPHIPSGRAINVYFRFIKDVMEEFSCNYSDDFIWEKIICATRNATTSSLKIDLGFFENAVNSSTRGSICEIGEYDLTMGSLFTAVLSQMADNFCKMADKIIAKDNNINNILFSGGVANRFDFVRDRISNHFADATIQTAQGDTLEGLYKYCIMSIHSHWESIS